MVSSDSSSCETVASQHMLSKEHFQSSASPIDIRDFLTMSSYAAVEVYIVGLHRIVRNWVRRDGSIPVVYMASVDSHFH